MHKQKKYFSMILGFILIFAILTCSKRPDGETITSVLGVKDNPRSPFYLNVNNLPKPTEQGFNDLPIGIFDSGTGGLTVLEAMLSIDEFDNISGEIKAGGDGVPDFAKEKFIYHGDMANMPYGNYPSVGRTGFLAELSVKDALFLLNTKYHSSSEQPEIKNKSTVKTIVIACNTGTAYGKKYIEEMIDFLGLDIDVIGVISSGARGAIECFNAEMEGTIGIMATVGTVNSESYPNSMKKQIKEKGYNLNIDIVQQGCFGLAGAIDGDKNYIDYDRKNNILRDDYIGPSLKNDEYPIKNEYLPYYNFVQGNGELLIQKGNEIDIYLNSVRNYVRYYVTELAVKIKNRNLKPPLRVIILGCTHYPYVQDEITKHLEFLAGYEEENGNKPFEVYLKEKVILVDPAELTAKITMASLIEKNILRNMGKSSKEFYISVPNKSNYGVMVNPDGDFTYEYKYNREPFYLNSDTKKIPPIYVLRIPMIWQTLKPAAIKQIEERLPKTYITMKEFNDTFYH